ncbi:SusC/RagA family TonB-linked outer membrane protein [Membranicola marinus]|uniref:SusC/RagA family TonB-linked outer membrane protein n=1 Tax=Membranihabitans marinus TaxID=1227546 RepID=A0A953HXP5_9BACT|nr:SusC/RagA family TonB-linked outer membrane protein [Membranihabitans marinus]MBY5957632.1 SusC/RagA family TonB-linked outer membrane protein [Membranihabitans marinus]
MKRILLLIVCLCSMGVILKAQNVVSGKVTDSAGEPLIGANILAEGTSIGAVTDFDGLYEIEIPEGATVLIFSYTGFESVKEPIDDRSTIDVSLTEGQLLDEVVVTALGISREKKSLGYAVQEVGAEELTQAQPTDALSALSGKVSGVQLRQSSNIGGSNRIVIRGASSFLGENQPLIVLDGLPIDNSNFNTKATQGGNGGVDYGNMLNDLNVDDIESISVLKGTGAALYGSRAANGVIVITTKKGNIGREQFGVNFSSSVGFEDAYMMPDLQRKYGGGAIISDADGGQDGFEVVNIEGQDYKVVQYGIDESWGPRYNPNISVLHWDAFSKESYPEQYLRPRPWVAPENDVDAFFNTGVTYTNSLAIDRSSQDYGVRFSYSNTSGTGTIPGSALHKNNFSLNGDAKLFENLKAEAYLNYIKSTTKGRPVLGYPASGQRYGNTFGQTLFQWTQRQLDYKRMAEYKNLDGTQRSWNRNAWDDATPHYSDSHYWIAHENYGDDERDRVLGNFGLHYTILDGLVLSGRVSADSYSFYSRERVAYGSQAESSYFESIRNNLEYNLETTLNFDRQLSDNISLSAMAGGNQFRLRYHYNDGATSGGLVVPNLYNLLNSSGTIIAEDLSRVKKINSVFGSVGVGIGNMLYVDLTARNDWSSTLPADHNSYFYPSVSTSFVFSELMSPGSWLSYGKIRLGWAQIGKDTDPYNVNPVYSFSSYLVSNPLSGPFQGATRVYVPIKLLNQDLKPETTTTWEAGVELSAFDDRLGLDVTFFNNTTTDQILPLELSKATGYDSKFINAGEIENQGVELSLSAGVVRSNDFNWNVNINFTKVNNEVVEIAEGIDAIDIGTAPFSGVTLRASVGQPYGQLWGYDFLYDDNGNRIVGDNGYWLRTQNLVPMGTVTPDYNIGLGSNFNYKGVRLNVLFDIQKGGKFYSVSHMWGHYAGTWAPTAGGNDKGNEIRAGVEEGGGIKLDGVTADVTFNDDGTYTVSNVQPNEKYVSGQGWAARHYHGFGMPSAQSLFDADYIKLRELSLGYTFDFSERNVGVSRITLTAYGRNIWTGGLAWDGLDPEMTVNGSGNIQGIEGGFLPTSRTFGLKLNLGI